MVYQSRNRKRVNALPRAPDGSAFQNCESCGVSVAIALVGMHECEPKKDVKRLKVEKGQTQNFKDQPRSEFRFFMESFMQKWETDDLIEMDRQGFETWKNMSLQEKLPYEIQARKVNDAYTKKLLKEEENMCSKADEVADSAEVGKFDKIEVYHGPFDDSDDYSDEESSEGERVNYEKGGL